MQSPEDRQRYRATMLLIAVGLGAPLVALEYGLGHHWPWKALWLLSCGVVALWLRSLSEPPPRWALVGLASLFTALGPASIALGERTFVELATIGAMPLVAAVLFIERFEVVVGVSVAGWLANTALFASTDQDPSHVASISARLAVGAAVVCGTSWYNRRQRSEARKTNAQQQALLRLSEMRRAQAERLATVGRLAAGVAHEINNPLAYVKSNVGAVEAHLSGKDALPPHELEEVLRDTRLGIDRICQIVGDLKAWTREDGEAREEVDLEELVTSTLRLAAVRLPRGLPVSVSVPATLPRVWAHPRKLAQVVLNLLINAGDAVEEAHTSQPAVSLEANLDGDRVVLSVKDNGPGISAEAYPRLFEPFFTTKAPGKGTGLGLALSREYLESFGGSIVALDAGPGAHFKVTLQASL